MMVGVLRDRLHVLRYLLAMVAVGFAAILVQLIWPMVYPSITPPFILAVALVALYGGKGPGMLASVLSAVVLGFFFFPMPVDDSTNLSRLLMFLLIATVATWVAGTVYEQRWEALRQAEENDRLRYLAEEAAAEAEVAAQDAADALSRQMHAETSLQWREAELMDFFETASMGMHWIGKDGTILRANQAELDLLGYERDEYVGHHLAEFHADPLAGEELLRQLTSEKTLREYPTRLRCKGGQVKDVLVDASMYFDEGRLVHTRCFIRDVTTEKQAQYAIRRLAAIVTSSSDAIVSKTLDGTITSWNAAAERIFGYTAEEIVGQPVFILIPEEFHEGERVLLERLSLGEMVELSEVERIRSDGTRIWISLSVSPIRDSSGAVSGIASIKRDITERKRAEAQLHQSQEQLWLAHQAARIGTWRWDIDKNTVRWDDALRQLCGLRDDESVNDYNDFLKRVHPEDELRVGQAVQQALAGANTLDYEFRILQANGQVRWLANLGRVTRDSAGRALYLTGICMDVTERKAMEGHLRDTQRLQAAGQLAGGIAHEANNQMTVVLGATQFLLRRDDLAPAAREDIEYIQQAASRTASITQQLLAFSRRQVLRLQDLDLNAAVQSIEPVLRRSLSENQQIVLRLGLRDRLVRADLSQLEQVLLNLTLNARDAMPDGGWLTIETLETEVHAQDVENGGPPPGTYATMVIEDTGHGMSQATLQRAFEPFFTTKEIGQGTGLGLAVVHGIVTQIGGYVVATSAPGQGAKFLLYFPIALANPVVAGAHSTLESASAFQGKVALVVEDDPAVRSMAIRGLAEAGYVILEAPHGRAAVELVRQHRGPIDIVITDIGMPEMNGHELARFLQAERPGLSIVFMSGYGDAETEYPFLQKPFSPDVLIRRVGEVLAAKRDQD